jgi:hypothetical protein
MEDKNPKVNPLIGIKIALPSNQGIALLPPMAQKAQIDNRIITKKNQVKIKRIENLGLKIKNIIQHLNHQIKIRTTEQGATLPLNFPISTLV